MAIFRYQAVDAAGKLLIGEQESDNVQQALVQLEGRGLTVQSIGLVAADSAIRASEPLVADEHAMPGKSSGESVEQAVLRAHMATILDRGAAILPALEAFAGELPAGRKRRQMLSVCRVLASGDPAAATKALSELPEYWIPLLSTATSSTDAGDLLRKFLSEVRRTDELRQQWWLTLAYPVVLFGLAAMVMIALSIFVIPEFGKIFAEFGLQMPVLTQLVLDIASWLSTWSGLVIAALMGALILLALIATRFLPAWRFATLSNLLHLPFGRRTAIARFARFTADLLEAGMNLPDALRIAAFTVDRSQVQLAAWSLAKEIASTGKCAYRAYSQPLTSTVFYALTADMPPEARIRLLRETSNCHADRVRRALSWTSGIVEPIGIALVGLAVGTVVLALYLPLIKLIDGLTG